MTEDADIKELERMLGGTRAAYQGLRHDAPLRTAPAVRRRPYRRLALVATVLLAVTFVGLGVLEEMTKPRASTLAFSRPTAALAQMRAAPGVRLTASRPSMKVRLRLPSRPSKPVAQSRG